MVLFSLKEQWRLPLMGAALFLSYLSVALPLPILSLHVTSNYGIPNWLGGFAIGSAFISTLFSRPLAGAYSDKFGGKLCTMWGLLLYCVAACTCLFSVIDTLPIFLAYGILIIGRLILGVGESFALVGVISWNVSLSGVQNSGKVMAIVGMALYGAFTVGGPLGLILYGKIGFAGLMLFSLVLPCFGYLILRNFPACIPVVTESKKQSFFLVLQKIWKLGMVVGLQGVGFAVLGAFITLYFQSKGWAYAGFGLTFFGAGFVLVRILCGHLPDKLGGLPVAIVSLIIEAVGQYVLWSAPNLWLAFIGATLTGIGCSMIYPSIGVEVVRKVAKEQRSTALGGFAAFQDIAYAVSAPIAGFLADIYGYSIVFLIGAVAATGGLLIAFSLWNKTFIRASAVVVAK